MCFSFSNFVAQDANGRNATSQNVTVMLSSPLLLRPQSGRRMAENSTAALTPNMTFDDLPRVSYASFVQKQANAELC